MPDLDLLLDAWKGEEIHIHRDDPTGAWIVIAIHSTALGPAAGGTRMKPYPDPTAAVEDALRLSEGMTYKFAAPGLPFGGAKAVIAVPLELDAAERASLLVRYGRMIASLGGRFRTGPDAGTTPADMDVIAETAGANVFARTPAAGGAGDPGPFTALGVFTGIEAACEHVFGGSVAGRRVLVQGAGDVGAVLIDLLEGAGAAVTFSEVDEGLISRFRDDRGIPFVDPDVVIGSECDVFAPCAFGGILTKESIPRLRCRVVAGSANNQLENPSDADLLREAGILYAPDFVTNVGGAMAIPSIETMGWTEEHAREEVRSYVRETLIAVFDESDRTTRSTADAAIARAKRHLAATRAT